MPQWSTSIPPGGALSSMGSCSLGWEKGVGDCRDAAVTHNFVLFGSLEENSGRGRNYVFFWRKHGFRVEMVAKHAGDPPLVTMIYFW